MTINNCIKELRARHHMTQSDLATAVGVSRQTIAALEKGSYTPSLLLAMRIARTFGLPTDDIFSLEAEEEK
ncbi:MAG: helix-turn-helix transcriptional regulator [Bacillus sp. (in: firmicutes)]